MKQTAAGAAGAAHGFFYQYLRTAEAALNHLQVRGPEVVIVAEDPRAHIVDYSVQSSDGHNQLLVQVKSSIAGRSLGISVAVSVLLRLTDLDAEAYLLETNRELTAATEQLAALLDAPDDSSDSHWQAKFIASAADAHDWSTVTNDQWRRLRRSRIRFDPRSAQEVKADLAEKIAMRRHAAHAPVTEESTDLLVSQMVSTIFERSAEKEQRCIDAATINNIVRTHDTTIAVSLGRFDVGITMTSFPPPPAIDRPEVVQSVLDRIEPAWNQRTTVVRCAMRGLSGIGKSTVAAAVGYASAHAYDRLVWIDAEQSATIRAHIEQLVAHLDTSVDPGQAQEMSELQLQNHLARLIAASPCRWLFVFDNALDVDTISTWVPSRGRVAVLATTTNHRGWTRWNPIDVGPMTSTEAAEMIFARLGIDTPSATDHEYSQRLAVRLEYWPLAIDLACSYLAGSQQGLELSADYLTQISHAVATTEHWRVDGYPRSLVQAIVFALATARTAAQQNGASALTLADVMAFFPSRANNTRTACASLHELRAIDAGEEKQARPTLSQFEVDTAISEVLTASLVTRPNTTTVEMNEVVQEVIRNHQHPELVATALGSSIRVVSDELLRLNIARDFAATNRLLPAAHTLIEHLTIRLPMEIAGIHLYPAIVLVGNLAEAHITRLEFGEAERLFLLERRLLHGTLPKTISTPGILEFKILVGFAVCAVKSGGNVDEAVRRIEEAAKLYEHVRDGAGNRLATELDRLVDLTTSLASAWPVDDSVHTVHRRVIDLVAIDHNPSQLLLGHKAIESALKNGNDVEARAICEGILAAKDTPLEMVPAIMGSRVEALSNLGEYEQAQTQLIDASEFLSHHGLPVAHLAAAVRNTLYALTPGYVADNEMCGARVHLMDTALSLANHINETWNGLEPDLALLVWVMRCRTDHLPELQTAHTALSRSPLRENNPAVLQNLLEFGRGVLELRELLNGAPIITVRAWTRMYAAESPKTVVGVGIRIADQDRHHLAKFSTRAGMWTFVSNRGCGLALFPTSGDVADSIVLWCEADQSGHSELTQAVVLGHSRRELGIARILDTNHQELAIVDTTIVMFQ